MCDPIIVSPFSGTANDTNKLRLKWATSPPCVMRVHNSSCHHSQYNFISRRVAIQLNERIYFSPLSLFSWWISLNFIHFDRCQPDARRWRNSHNDCFAIPLLRWFRPYPWEKGIILNKRTHMRERSRAPVRIHKIQSTSLRRDFRNVLTMRWHRMFLVWRQNEFTLVGY